VAQERAQKRGVAANCVLRYGSLRQELVVPSRELDIAWVVLGKPAGDESAFVLADLEALTAQTEDDAGVETYIV
jgi:hypothetical protein